MLKQFGEQLLSSLSQDYYFDLYLIDFQVIKGTHLSTENKRKYIQATIKQYQKFHPNFQYSKIQKNIEVENYFIELINHDIVIFFKGATIYRELYKILYLIDNTFEVQKLLNNSKKYPDKFAKIQSDLKAVKSFHKQYKNNLFGLRNIMDKGQSRFRYWITTVYIKNKKLTKFFTHLFIIGDFIKVKDFYNDNKSQELLLNELDFFLMQRTTISKVVKSFGILLYWEMVKYLKINRKEAEEYTSHIIYVLFKENFNAEELHKIIEIKSSIGYYPVFGASKKASLSKSEQQFISNKLYKQIKEYISIEQDDFTPLFESYIKTPHIQYLEKYPVELFRINPKYSSIH
jgi:hypothetical protein